VPVLLALSLLIVGQVFSAESGEPPQTTETEAAPVETVGEAKIRLNVREGSLDSVLEYLSEAAGLAVIREVELEGRVTVLSRRPLSVGEAVALLNSVLKEKGYAAVRTGRTLKIVDLERAKQMNIPVRAGSDPQQIEPTDQVITQVIPIRYADATKLREDLGPLIPDYAELAANASSNSLILTDTAANIRRICEIVQGVDTHMSLVTDVKVYPLTYAGAGDAARLINEIFGQEAAVQQQDSRRSSRFAMFRRFARGGRGDEDVDAEADSGPSQKVSASADVRTNTVVVTGPPQILQVVEGVLEKLDASPSARLTDIRVFHLEYASATEAARMVNEVFAGESQQEDDQRSRRRFFTRGRDSEGEEGGSAVEEVTAAADEQTNTVVVSGPTEMLEVVEKVIVELDSNPSAEQSVYVYRLKNANASNLQEVLNDLFEESESADTRTGRDTSRRFGRSTQASATVDAVANALAGEVYFRADEDTNSLLVITAEKNFERVRVVLEELDRPVPQVLIKVLLAEVTHDRTVDLGVEFSVLNLDADGFGQEVFTDFNLLNQTTGAVAKVVEPDVSVALRALKEVGTLDVLSRPYILTSDNQAATITVGQEVPFIRETRTTETGQTINTIEYEDIGIILEVTPHINPEGLVILDVRPEISTIQDTTVPISETLNAPTFGKRSAESKVGILNGQTIVIGGLVEDRKNKTVRKVPLLGSIPLLGALFRRTEDTTQKTELLIFLTPHVARNATDLEAMSGDEQSGSEVVPGAIAPGRFEEHMNGMKRGASPRSDEGE
jgi:general secretion pathway protein D